LSAERTVPNPVALWTSRAFIEEARAWVAAQLALRGSRLTGKWEQPHVRVWSSTIRFETTEGRVWFKVNASGTAYEAALVALLGELRPGLAPVVLAHDDARAWSLSRDGGPVLRSIAGPEALWGYWERLLPRYAEAQLGLADHRLRLLTTGIPDRGPARLPLEYRRLLDELGARPTADGGLTHEEASASIAFHAGLLRENRDDDRQVDDPRLLRILDAYLEPFVGLGCRAELLRWMALARSTGCLTRALSWERALQEAPSMGVAGEGFPVRGWLLELLKPWADLA
jgi:hypothetical protein